MLWSIDCRMSYLDVHFSFFFDKLLHISYYNVKDQDFAAILLVGEENCSRLVLRTFTRVVKVISACFMKGLKGDRIFNRRWFHDFLRAGSARMFVKEMSNSAARFLMRCNASRSRRINVIVCKGFYFSRILIRRFVRFYRRFTILIIHASDYVGRSQFIKRFFARFIPLFSRFKSSNRWWKSTRQFNSVDVHTKFSAFRVFFFRVRNN